MLRRWLWAALLLWPLASALAADPAPAVTPTQAQSLADTLQDPTKRDQLIGTLRTLAASTTPPAATALKPGSVGEQVVGHAGELFGDVTEQLQTSVQQLRGLPALARWFGRIGTDEQLRDLVLHASGLALAIVAIAYGVMKMAERATRPLLRSIDHAPAPDHSPASHGRAWRLTKRLPWMLLRALVRLLPVLGFALVGNLLVGSSVVELQATRVIAFDTIATYVIFRLTLAASDLIYSPHAARWRLFEFRDTTARYAATWVRRLAIVVLFGALVANVAGVLGMPQSATQTILKFVALIAHLLLVVVAWQCRQSVAVRIAAWGQGTRVVGGLTGRLANTWVWLASFLNLLMWFVWATQPEGGVGRVLRVVLVTFAILIAARVVLILLLGALDRALPVGSGLVSGRAATDRRAVWHRRLHGILQSVVGVVAAVAVLQSWGFDPVGSLQPGEIGARLLSTFGTLLLTVAIAAIVWELTTGALDRNTLKLAAEGRAAQAQRLRTLTPLLRTCLLIAILVIVGLTALSEIGVNTGPLLAGASIFGVALGFGAQKLVQDFITGIFLLLENAMQVGEWVTVANLSGTVERLSIRTIQLRGSDGSLYVIPFSSVTTVNNTNRGIGNAAVSVTVSAAVDTDRVGEEIKRIGSEMRDDPAFAALIRSDLAYWGVDRIDASTATLAGQIECTDAGRWGVQREFNRRVKKRFAELGIPLANPATAVLLTEMPAAPPSQPGQSASRDPGESAASVAVSPPPHR